MPTLPGGHAPDLALAPLEQPGDRHRDHAVLVGEARPVGGVVLQVEVVDAQLGTQAVGPDQGRVAGVLPDPRLGSRVDDRQQLLEVPDVLGALGGGEVAEVARRQLVVVDHVEALAAVRAGEDRVLQRVAVITAVATQARRARAGPLPRALGGLCGVRAHAGTCERYDGPRRLCGALVTAEVDPQLLAEVGTHRPEHLGEGPQRRQQGVRVRLRQLRLACPHTLLEVLDAVEHPHHVTGRAVHLELLHVGGDALDAVLTPLAQFDPQVLGLVPLLLAPVGPARASCVAAASASASFACV